VIHVDRPPRIIYPCIPLFSGIDGPYAHRTGGTPFTSLLVSQRFMGGCRPLFPLFVSLVCLFLLLFLFPPSDSCLRTPLLPAQAQKVVVSFVTQPKCLHERSGFSPHCARMVNASPFTRFPPNPFVGPPRTSCEVSPFLSSFSMFASNFSCGYPGVKSLAAGPQR